MPVRKPPEYYRIVNEKKRFLRDYYGGLMTMKQVMKELGYGDKRNAKMWLEAHGVYGVTMNGSRLKYDVDQLAQAIVDARGVAV